MKDCIDGIPRMTAIWATGMLVALLLTVGGACAAPSASLRVISPHAGATVRGTVPFAVEIQNLPSLASVEYYLNGRSLSGPLAVQPYRYDWPSSLVWDGPATIQAVARDSQGVELAESPVVPFVVANGTATIRLTSPDPSQALRGTVQLSVEAGRPIPDQEVAEKQAHHVPVYPIAALMFFVDGQQIAIRYGRTSATVGLDTTHLSNGVHELFIAAYSSETGIPPAAMVQIPVTVQNGHTIREVRSRFHDLFVRPGQSEPLAPRLVYTDGVEEPVAQGAKFLSDTPAVATVDAGGTVTAVAPGVAKITVTAAGLTTTTRVIVDSAHGFPHFARDGQILTQYDPNRSLFIRSMILLGPQELDHTPGLAQQARAAGINALTTGFYRNPADSNRPLDLNTWRQGWEPWWNQMEATAGKEGFSLVLTGDDIVRTARELSNSISNPWSAQAIQMAFTRLRDGKRAICVEMMDEASLWGSTPAPTDGRWQKKNPPIPDDAFVRVMQIINGVQGRPPVSWPVLGMSPPRVAGNWMGNPLFSDYASQYWTYMDWRRAYPYGASLPQDRAALDRVVIGRRPFLQPHAPSLMLTSAAGPFYTKEGPGDEYVPGQDRQLAPSTPPVSVAAQLMYAAAMGMSGVRIYAFDAQENKQRRANAKVNAELETYSDPWQTGTDRWQAMASALHLIQRLEADLLQPPVSAVDLGPHIATGAHAGPGGRVLIAINFSESSETARVDLAPYRYPGGPAIVRYRLAGAALRTDTIPNLESDLMTFAPGEAVTWLLRPIPAASALDVTPPSIALVAPLPGATVAGQVTVEAAATDQTKLDRVEFWIDGRFAGAAKAPPYSFLWDTTGAKSGVWHGVSAVAYDASGNSSEARLMLRVAPR